MNMHLCCASAGLKPSGCLCLKGSSSFNVSSPSLSSSGLILSGCRWGTLSPQGLQPAPSLLDQAGPQGQAESQEEVGRKRISKVIAEEGHEDQVLCVFIHINILLESRAAGLDLKMVIL